MEYPPRRQVQEDGSEVWAPETGEDGVERISIIESERVGYGLVHFDLDPKNGKDNPYAFHQAIFADW